MTDENQNPETATSEVDMTRLVLYPSKKLPRFGKFVFIYF